MQLTPSQAFEHIKESIVGYLETAYKISHPAVSDERRLLLERQGAVAQAPFVESTPAFPTSHRLQQLENEHAFVPNGLGDLLAHGVPVGRFPLWIHQEQSLMTSFSDKPNLLVATGTGSGKTECFLLPILAEILNETANWSRPSGESARGYYDHDTSEWLHSRRHETRPAAVRALVLYPMNALVNDQLSRLRRILGRNGSPDWQRDNLNGNVIHFGMYTGMTPIAGHWSQTWRVEKVQEYLDDIEADWDRLSWPLRESGSWPNPDSPEMLLRWDMQASPPDILVTNYSMLEYMLVRPIDSPVFDATRKWLHSNDDARFTLVLDEAHTYTGAKGTEVAHLARRLKERLGIAQCPSKFRAIATTASTPPGRNEQLRSFVSDLFGEDSETFSLIELPGDSDSSEIERKAVRQNMTAFARFQHEFSLREPWPAIVQLSDDLRIPHPDQSLDPSVALYRMLKDQADLDWIRSRTARNATPLDELAAQAWENSGGNDEEREMATAGVLAAGAFARAENDTDTPPLLSMRMHGLFRGLPGIWACMNDKCSVVTSEYQSEDRPVGKLYVEPRPWCECGARVLELFSCRRCGLLFLGGIPDTYEGGLWPWSDDLTGTQHDLHQYRVFGVESPHPEYPVSVRSTRTTLSSKPGEALTRPVYEIEPATQSGSQISPFPQKCPRCSNYRAPGRTGREVIEPLRTKGPVALAMIIEDAYRVQPRSSSGKRPNYGRKALLFSDSRMEAATLAPDLRRIHHQDLFRQLLFRVLHTCARCEGSGEVESSSGFRIGETPNIVQVECPVCTGTGRAQGTPVDFSDLRDRVIQMQIDRSINPTNGEIEQFFAEYDNGNLTVCDEAEISFNIALRRELSEDEFGLEPLGLASWRVPLGDDLGTFDPLTEDETKVFIQTVARILATENILLPPEPVKPWQWPFDRVPEYERQVMIPAPSRVNDRVVPYNLKKYRKLGRYVQALGSALVDTGRLDGSRSKHRWVRDLSWPLWNALAPYGLHVLDYAGRKIDGKAPMGIRIDKFRLHPLKGSVHRCKSCAYVMSRAVLNVCARCGQATESVEPSAIRSFYRRSAFLALPHSGFDDPYPLRVIEHTAQIGKEEARDCERWFQDLFRDDQHPDDHRIDILSVTTTMEMGIDIGSLLTVGLRNVPPTVANYQQRAGRAGRRGSALANVLTFSQFRSHDQYYFDRPPEIVSDPPRVPVLYLENEIIARRHVRSLVLQSFFADRSAGVSTLFKAWGTVGDFLSSDVDIQLSRFLDDNHHQLADRCRLIVNEKFRPQIQDWIASIPIELQETIEHRDPKSEILETLVNSGLLPKYAFPVDVVSLVVPSDYPNGAESNDIYEDQIQRDLKIAISEYAPGAEVIKGSFPNTYIYPIAGLYDPFDKDPDYAPTGQLLECSSCQAIDLLPIGVDRDHCPECDSPEVDAISYIKPRGFTVDQSRPDLGKQKYDSGGRERVGHVSPARLLVGQSSFADGTRINSFAPNLYVKVKTGTLFICNKGAYRRYDSQGFVICPTCGRALNPDDVGKHSYPASVPPHYGPSKGPRAGDLCPNTSDFKNGVILGHDFHSEVILMGVDLPPEMDAPFTEPSGKALWYSFGTLVKNAATTHLQINPEELVVGVRPARRSPDRLHGEVFLYDDVPGGAGYARAIRSNMQDILGKALLLSEDCSNLHCSGACYNCLYDYRNQFIHSLLDRDLGSCILRFILEDKLPENDPRQSERALKSFVEYAGQGWVLRPSRELLDTHHAGIIQDRKGHPYAIRVVHPAGARPSRADAEAIQHMHGVRSLAFTSFDLMRRPFWVLNNLKRQGLSRSRRDKAGNGDER